MKKIALLGATGYIGRSLLAEFLDEKDKVRLFLFSRSKDKIKGVIKDRPEDHDTKLCSLSEFNLFDYDVVINCTGIKSLLLLKQNPSEVFNVTEEIDNMVIGYLKKNPKTLYINISSGAVYGENFAQAVSAKTKTVLSINNINASECYAIAKMNSEAKHRALPNLNIVDLRIFSFFSHFADVSPVFLMSEAVDCIKNKKILKTNDENIIRDYICSKDLFSLIKAVIKKQKINDFFDAYSLKSVSKFELLSFLEKKYGLKYIIEKSPRANNKIESKNVYYSKDRKLKDIGYSPRFSSLKGIESEIDRMDL